MKANGRVLAPVTSRDGWLVGPRPAPDARWRLVCVPHAGAGPSVFRDWPDHLPSDVEVWGVQLPGREGRLREPPLARLVDVVTALAAALAGQLDRPFALFGHSMGALVAFELARRLRRESGPEPLGLFVSAFGAPRVADRRPPLHALPEADFVAAIRARYGGIPEAVLRCPELMTLLLPALRADFAVVETYRYEEERPLACRVVGFGGVADAATAPEQLDAWRHETRGPFTRAMYPGGHFFLHAHAPAMLRTMAPAIADAISP